MERSFRGIAGNSPRLHKIVTSAVKALDPIIEWEGTEALDREVARATRLYLTIWAEEAEGAEG